MTDLRAALEAAGCTNVRSYIGSGNVLFDADDQTTLLGMQEAVHALTGTRDNVFLRSPADLSAIVGGHPFGDLTADRQVKLYVVFLAAPPAQIPALPAIDERERLELTAVQGLEAYLVSRRKPSGMYGFPTLFLERELGVSTTARSWGTVTRLHSLATVAAGT
jgi:uncharacterized protein (DUF1697 family)